MPASPNQVRIQAPCRIHLGLLSVHAYRGRRFGGAGVMLDQPAIELSAQRSDRNQFGGLFVGRTTQFVDTWRQYTGIQEPIRIDVTKSAPEHVGLGLGTQLGMSVATALDELFDRSTVPVETRAQSVGRGLRSAVGAHGFHRGGLIVDGGKREEESLGQLAGHVDLPRDWHVVLVRTQQRQGLAGTDEVRAFHNLSRSLNPANAGELYSTLFDELLPAARQGDFGQFSEAVFRYGLQAGEIFAESQGGPFLNDQVARLVESCRHQGVGGVGQSSWGPTVFCWFDNKAAADDFRSKLTTIQGPNLELEITVSAVSRRGAQVTVS